VPSTSSPARDLDPRVNARLRLAPRPSRIGCIWVSALCALSIGLLIALPLEWIAWLPCAVAVAAVLVSGLWRCTGRGVPALIHVGRDRRITVTDSNGRSHAGSILDDTFVGAWLTTIVWRRDGLPWWRPASAIVVLPDMLPGEARRRLRVALRYGVPATRDAMSDAAAARPASQA
jgi:hypothetical protein